MIRVIKKSQTFEVFCNACLVTLSYEGVDIKERRTSGKGKLIYRYITCPECARSVVISVGDYYGAMRVPK